MVPSLTTTIQVLSLLLKSNVINYCLFELYLPLQMANSTMNAFALSSTSYDSFQDSHCLNMQHFIFPNPIKRTTCGNETWVSDIGATCHIVHSITLFTLITSSTSTFIQLPNGKRATITHIGTIQVTTTLKLENVLCVPSFSFNLISVTKLTKTLSWCFVFLSTCCFIRDLTCWKTIGVGKLHNDLYLMQASTSCNSILYVSSILKSVFTSFVNSVSSTLVVSKPFLWHLRLGRVWQQASSFTIYHFRCTWFP